MAQTREEKIKKILALEEKRKRVLKAKPQYKPTPGQLTVLESKAKNLFLFSGNGAGKSTLLVHLLMAAAKGVNPWNGTKTKVPARITFVVDSSRKISERILPELMKWYDIPDSWLKRLGKPYVSRIEFDNGSVVDFYSSDADPSSFEGTESSTVLVDEPIPRVLYVALKRSLRLKGHLCNFIFAGTAISEAWLRREIYEPWAKGETPNTECFRLGSADNEANLAAGYLEEFGRSLSEAEKEVRLKGGFFDTDALALSHLWNREKHILPFDTYVHDPKAPCVVAVDNHSTKAHTALMVTVDRSDNFIVLKEFRLRGNAQQFAEGLLGWMKGYNVIEIVCDSLGSMEMSSGEGMHSFIDGMNKHLLKTGYNVRPTRFKEKSHEDLVDRLRQGLTIPLEPNQFGEVVPKLRVLSHLKSLINDIENATWQKNRMTGEQVAKIDTSVRDHLSCLGYALATHLFYDKLTRGKPAYQDAVAGQLGGRTAAEKRPEARKEFIEQRKARMQFRRGARKFKSLCR